MNEKIYNVAVNVAEINDAEKQKTKRNERARKVRRSKQQGDTPPTNGKRRKRRVDGRQ